MKLDSTLIDLLTQEGILREGHFAFRSGRHSNRLIDRDLLLADPQVASHFGYAISKYFFKDRLDTIATPSIWGSGLAQWIGYFLDPSAKIVDATIENDDVLVPSILDPMIDGKRLLLVDNLILTGHTMTAFTDYFSSHNATIVGIATLWNAGDQEIDGVPVFALLNEMFPAHEPEHCPDCLLPEIPLEQIDY